MIADLRYIVLDRLGRKDELKMENLLHFLEWLEVHNININKININRLSFWLDVWKRESVIYFHD